LREHLISYIKSKLKLCHDNERKELSQDYEEDPR
jgi:hypothetical protein